MRRFNVVRERDISGVSGVGNVAEGVLFTDGKVAMRWLTEHATTTFFDSLEDLILIHGHEGATRVEFIDQEVMK